MELHQLQLIMISPAAGAAHHFVGSIRQLTTRCSMTVRCCVGLRLYQVMTANLATEFAQREAQGTRATRDGSARPGSRTKHLPQVCCPTYRRGRARFGVGLGLPATGRFARPRSERFPTQSETAVCSRSEPGTITFKNRSRQVPRWHPIETPQEILERTRAGRTDSQERERTASIRSSVILREPRRNAAHMIARARILGRTRRLTQSGTHACNLSPDTRPLMRRRRAWAMHLGSWSSQCEHDGV